MPIECFCRAHDCAMSNADIAIHEVETRHARQMQPQRKILVCGAADLPNVSTIFDSSVF